MTKYRIPFNRPSLAGAEFEYMRRALESGHASGDGPYSRACQRLLEERLGASKVLLTTSCTDALELAALLLRIAPGDEIIVPSFTFVSTVNAFVLRGAQPVFVDIRGDTLNLDERLVARHITPHTKAIVVMHYGGVACEMAALLSLASDHGVTIVEDNAHGLFGKYRGQMLGTFGRLSTLSFHETKNISCGEGGALVVNDPELVNRAEILREKGTDRSRFFRGEVDKYTWVDVGSSFLPSDLLAAFLLAQLEAAEAIHEKRRVVWHRYADSLVQWAGRVGARLPIVPAAVEQSYHLFYVLMPEPEMRARLIGHLKSKGILAVFHYLPLHSSPMGRALGTDQTACPVTKSVSDRLLRLPFYTDLSHDDQSAVIDAILEFGIE